ncbi:hypothetical protein MRB53_002602 [Persea americana]|uniref:Uncharacterized protein n=1 Tax=Persea americana TaxID=3435 RepID=A0ACC2MV60_PERAE|nr:hypothetical protein MRB53_002602 [Persea americana]
MRRTREKCKEREWKMKVSVRIEHGVGVKVRLLQVEWWEGGVAGAMLERWKEGRGEQLEIPQPIANSAKRGRNRGPNRGRGRINQQPAQPNFATSGASRSQSNHPSNPRSPSSSNRVACQICGRKESHCHDLLQQLSSFCTDPPRRLLAIFILQLEVFGEAVISPAIELRAQPEKKTRPQPLSRDCLFPAIAKDHCPLGLRLSRAITIVHQVSSLPRQGLDLVWMFFQCIR